MKKEQVWLMLLSLGINLGLIGSAYLAYHSWIKSNEPTSPIITKEAIHTSATQAAAQKPARQSYAS